MSSSTVKHKLTAVLATDFSSGTFLTPGVHHFKSSPASVLNLSISSTSDSVTILPPSHPVTFPLAIYGGEPTPQGLNSSSSDWESLYLPLGWYAVVGGQVGQAIRGVVSSRSELPAGSWKITGFGSGESPLPPWNTGKKLRKRTCRKARVTSSQLSSILG